MRLLIVTNKYDASDDLLGFLPGWIRALTTHGAHVTVITQFGADRPATPGVRTVVIPKRAYPNPLVRVMKFWRILWSMRREYDRVLFIMNPMWVIAASPVTLPLRKPMFLWYAVWRGTWRLRLATVLSHRVLTSVPEAFPFHSSKVSAIGQGIDTDLFSPVSGRRVPGSILFVGRISPVKRLEILLRAAADVPSAELIIAGAPIHDTDRAYETRMKDLAVSLGIDERVSWLGRVPHDSVAPLYQSADVFVNLTPAGSFDKTALEAMACGTIVVSSNSALLRFLSESDARRLAFSDAHDLARVLDDLLSDPARDGMRERMRNVVVRNHSLERWTTNLITALG